MRLPSGLSTTDYSISAASKGWGAGWPNCTAMNSGQMVKFKLSRSGTDIAGGIHRNIVELFGLIANEVERRGYMFHPGWCWGASCRAIAGTNRASNHSWGLAVDINAPNNPYTSSGVHDIPDWAFALFRQYGFGVGADYSGKQDWMHVEFMGNVSDAAVMTGLARKNIGGGVVIDPPEEDDSMSAAEVADLKNHIDNRLMNRDQGSHSVFDELRYVADKVFTPAINQAITAAQGAQSSSDAVKAALAGLGAGGSGSETYACVVDTESGWWYAVAPGEFWHIENMMEVNILRTAGVLVGQANLNHGDVVHLRTMVLREPGGVGDPPAPATYTVKAGDTLGAIAKANGVTVAQLQQWNGIANPDNISEGQVLRLGPQ